MEMGNTVFISFQNVIFQGKSYWETQNTGVAELSYQCEIGFVASNKSVVNGNE